MKCAKCDGALAVKETRQWGGAVYRRRRCATDGCRDIVTKEERSPGGRWPAGLVEETHQRLVKYKEGARAHK